MRKLLLAGLAPARSWLAPMPRTPGSTVINHNADQFASLPDGVRYPRASPPIRPPRHLRRHLRFRSEREQAHAVRERMAT